MSDGKPAEQGWMAEKPTHVRVYHYIYGEGRSLCGRYGCYAGELMADKGAPERGREDCAECFRRLRRRAPSPMRETGLGAISDCTAEGRDDE